MLKTTKAKAIPKPVKLKAITIKHPEVHVEKASNGFFLSRGSTYDDSRKTIVCKDEKELGLAIKEMFAK